VVSPSDEQRGRRPRRSEPHDPHEAGDDEVVSITSVPESRGDEQSRRMHVYFIQMVIRVACFVAAVFVTWWPLRIVLIAAAVILPYTAVIFANAGGERRTADNVGMDHPELPASPQAPQVIDNPTEGPDDPPSPDAPDEQPGDERHRSEPPR
jgi:hypothetical protein